MYFNKQLHPTGTLVTNFHKPAGGEKIRMSDLDMAHRQLSNTLEDHFQYQLMLIQLT